MLLYSEIFMCYKESYIATYKWVNQILSSGIENWNVFTKEELLGIFGCYILRTRKTENSRQQISLALGSDVYESADISHLQAQPYVTLIY